MATMYTVGKDTGIRRGSHGETLRKGPQKPFMWGRAGDGEDEDK